MPERTDRMDDKQIPLERAITDKIMAYLKGTAPDGWFFKIHGGIFQLAGIPDIIGVFRGRFVALEVKRPKVGRVTVLQATILRKISAAGGMAKVVHSVEEAAGVIEEVKERAR